MGCPIETQCFAAVPASRNSVVEMKDYVAQRDSLPLPSLPQAREAARNHLHVNILQECLARPSPLRFWTFACAQWIAVNQDRHWLSSTSHFDIGERPHSGPRMRFH